jgi:transcriptional regulator with XRE-family HTH domain
MNAEQCKMARAGIGWRAQDLADKAGVGYATVARFESGSPIADTSRDKLQATLQAAGARFSKWKDQVGVTVPRKPTLKERTADLAEAKAVVGKVRRAIRGAG